MIKAEPLSDVELGYIRRFNQEMRYPQLNIPRLVATIDDLKRRLDDAERLIAIRQNIRNGKYAV
jgi:hypothetical protein